MQKLFDQFHIHGAVAILCRKQPLLGIGTCIEASAIEIECLLKQLSLCIVIRQILCLLQAVSGAVFGEPLCAE